jgi:hypothetical protein
VNLFLKPLAFCALKSLVEPKIFDFFDRHPHNTSTTETGVKLADGEARD